MPRRPALLIAALIALVAAPSVAHAGTVGSRTSNESDRGGDRTVIALTFSAARGERNAVRIAVDATGATVTDRVAIRPGRNCFRPDGAGPRSVRCRFRGVSGLAGDDEERIEVNANARDRSDTVLVTGAFPGSRASNTVSTARLAGGKGNDRLQGIGDTATYLGGPGADAMRGGPGDDTFAQGSRPDGADTISGGGAFDRGDEVSYIRRRGPVRADLAGDRDDGARGERDRILDGIENLTGGRGGDRLSGDGGPNRIFSFGGADTVTGGAGHDYMSVGGKRGKRDVVRARDGQTDFVACDLGRQALELDDTDLFSDERRGPGCEAVRRSAPFASVLFTTGGEEVPSQPVRTEDGDADLPIACAPDGRAERCRGTARLEMDGRSLGSTAFVARDPFEFATITLSAADRALLAERGRLEVTLVLEMPEAGVTRRDLVVLTPFP